MADRKLRRSLPWSRLSGHSPAIEQGRHRQTWLPREARLGPFCPQERETEDHFLLQSMRDKELRGQYFMKSCPEFIELPCCQKLPSVKDRGAALPARSMDATRGYIGLPTHLVCSGFFSGVHVT